MPQRWTEENAQQQNITDAQTNPKQSSILATVINVVEADEIILIYVFIFISRSAGRTSSIREWPHGS